MYNTTMLSVLTSIMVFFTPLLFGSPTNEIFEFPKMVFVYVMGTTLVFSFLLGRIWQPAATKRKFVWPNMWALGLLFVMTLATFLSTHPYTSVWGYYSRFNDGLVSTVVFFGVYVVVINTFTKETLNKFLYLPVFTLIPIGFYGVLQHIKLGDTTRISSTFGQANWLAAYIAMVLPLVLYFLLKSNSRLPRLKYVLVITFVLAYAALWFSYSLSGLLGLGVGLGVLLVMNRELLVQHTKLLGLLGALVLAVSVTNPGIYKQRLHDVLFDIQKVYAQEIVQDKVVGDQISDPGYIRLGIWLGTLNLINSSPKNLLIGIGPETFAYEFQPFRPPELNYSSEWDFILNKPHNYYLEVFAETGLLGLVVYVGLMVHTLRKKHLALTACFAAFYVCNLFGWPTVATALLFWVFLGVVDLPTNSKQDIY